MGAGMGAGGEGHDGIAIIAGDAHPALAQQVAQLCGGSLVATTLGAFADGESRIRIESEIGGADLYIVQPTCAPTNEHLMTLALLTDAARCAGAARVTAVVPYFGYARQDVRKSPGEPHSARLVARSRVDAILVGDSAAMVMHGHPTTLKATVSIMAMHTRAVARACGGKFLIADLPFLSHRQGIPAATAAVAALMTSGAQAVKLEGVDGHEDVIRHIVGSGVPVMGHIGLTPQSVRR